MVNVTLIKACIWAVIEHLRFNPHFSRGRRNATLLISFENSKTKWVNLTELCRSSLLCINATHLHKRICAFMISWPEMAAARSHVLRISVKWVLAGYAVNSTVLDIETSGTAKHLQWEGHTIWRAFWLLKPPTPTPPQFQFSPRISANLFCKHDENVSGKILQKKT